ncbi:LysR substrate-binding domain-containing protein [Thalassotalea marina]|uniref:Transcriptional regulator GcvA n=1 Tax=Thalassotalea marina TaxID=1673741 RepID=A0A919BM08_9GAMM|nr:LysR substrate-binding domain-containing protein [Thalassotalea marina]GHG00265.1 transcriptional regulator GcvA [Thalassotalea marina]
MDIRLKQLNALHTFECAARHQSYSKAADELFISQAAVSQQMRLLEDKLRVKLFFRSGHSMYLTKQGNILYEACLQGFSQILTGLKAIQCEDIAGDLTITSTQAFCSLWLMPKLYKFSLLYPDINIRVLGSNAIEDLKKKHIDVAIRFSRNSDTVKRDGLVIEESGTISAYPVCSKALFASGKITQPSDLLNFQLISLANESEVTWQSWFAHAGVEGYHNDKKQIEVTSSDLALSAVLAGHGITLAASELFSQYLYSQQLVIPFNIKHPFDWQRFILYDGGSPRLKRIKVFTHWLKQELAKDNNTISKCNAGV